MIIVEICLGSSCYVKGASNTIEHIRNIIDQHQWNDKVQLKGAFCMGGCNQGLCVKIDDTLIHERSILDLLKKIETTIGGLLS